MAGAIMLLAVVLGLVGFTSTANAVSEWSAGRAGEAIEVFGGLDPTRNIYLVCHRGTMLANVITSPNDVVPGAKARSVMWRINGVEVRTTGKQDGVEGVNLSGQEAKAFVEAIYQARTSIYVESTLGSFEVSSEGAAAAVAPVLKACP